MGRGKYRPPELVDAPSRLEYVNEVLSPCERAVRQFEQFVRDWTPPAASGRVIDASVNAVRRAIRSIAPAAEVRQIVGWAVFRTEIDHRHDFVHVPVSPIFTKFDQAENSLTAFRERKPGEFAVCEVRQADMAVKR